MAAIYYKIIYSNNSYKYGVFKTSVRLLIWSSINTYIANRMNAWTKIMKLFCAGLKINYYSLSLMQKTDILKIIYLIVMAKEYKSCILVPIQITRSYMSYAAFSQHFIDVHHSTIHIKMKGKQHKLINLMANQAFSCCNNYYYSTYIDTVNPFSVVIEDPMPEYSKNVIDRTVLIKEHYNNLKHFFSKLEKKQDYNYCGRVYETFSYGDYVLGVDKEYTRLPNIEEVNNEEVLIKDGIAVFGIDKEIDF